MDKYEDLLAACRRVLAVSDDDEATMGEVCDAVGRELVPLVSPDRRVPRDEQDDPRAELAAVKARIRSALAECRNDSERAKLLSLLGETT